jgi:hypothetical protein
VATPWRPGDFVLPRDLSASAIDQIKMALSPAHVVALTVWAEARARLEPHVGWVPNPIEAMTDVIEVIDNRVTDYKDRWPGGHKAVCFARWQFSCWEPAGGLDNYRAVLERAQHLIAGDPISEKLRACLVAAETAVAGTPNWERFLPANTCHYYATSMPVPPAWAEGREPVAERYGHRFFANVP